MDICIGADKPENSFWKELLADGDDKAGDEEGADAQCHWECSEGFTEYAEECYATRKACVVKTTVVKGEVKEKIAVGVGSSVYQPGRGVYGRLFGSCFLHMRAMTVLKVIITVPALKPSRGIFLQQMARVGQPVPMTRNPLSMLFGTPKA